MPRHVTCMPRHRSAMLVIGFNVVPIKLHCSRVNIEAGSVARVKYPAVKQQCSLHRPTRVVTFLYSLLMRSIGYTCNRCSDDRAGSRGR